MSIHGPLRARSTSVRETRWGKGSGLGGDGTVGRPSATTLHRELTGCAPRSRLRRSGRRLSKLLRRIGCRLVRFHGLVGRVGTLGRRLRSVRNDLGRAIRQRQATFGTLITTGSDTSGVMGNVGYTVIGTRRRAIVHTAIYARRLAGIRRYATSRVGTRGRLLRRRDGGLAGRLHGGRNV